MPVQIKPSFIKTLPIHLNGNHVTEVRFRKEKGTYTRAQVMELGKKIRDRYKDKITGHMLVTTKFDFGWRNGKVTDIAAEDPDLFDLSNYYADIPANLRDKVWKQDEFKTFAIYLIPTKKAGGCNGSSYNDCLWRCLRDTFNGQHTCPASSTSPTS